MPIRRGFHRSQSEAMPSFEQAYRRAARELRDFHRARSLDVIFEEDHLNADNSENNGGTLRKKGACLCLADLADSHADVSEESVPPEGEEQQTFAGGNNKEVQGWGHYDVDSPIASSDSMEEHHHQQQQHQTHHHHPARMYPALTHKGRTIRRFGRS